MTGPKLVDGKETRVTRNPAKRRKNLAPRLAALKRLGLDPKDPPKVDVLSTKAILSVGSRDEFLDYARTSDDGRVVDLIEKFDALSEYDQGVITVPDLCAAAGITFAELLGEVVRVAFSHNTDLSNLIAAVNQPKVVQATVDAALKADGADDRKILHQHSGFVPIPKGSSTIVRFQQLINNAREVEPGDSPNTLPPFENDTILFNTAQRGKLLPADIEG